MSLGIINLYKIMKKKRIFITGAYGFIGSNLVKALQGEYDLVCYDKDICDGIKIKNDFDFIYHLAANSDTRFPDDVEMYRNNILGFLEVLKFALPKKTRVIYASSAALYGNKKKEKVINAYANSKKIIDEIAEQFFDKLPIVGLRPFNVYGPGELQKGKMASMITQWRTQILEGKRPIIFKGAFIRDFVYVKDVVKAMKQAMKLKSGIYDLGTGKATDFRKILELVIKNLDVKVKPRFINNPYLGKYQVFTKADISWGFKPDYTPEKGIKDYFRNECH
jgi:ADP-L-glycero-D-manno-heptose 6-epimerase